MKLFSLHIIKLFSLFILLSLTSCQTIDVRGQYVSDTAIQEINNKKMTQNQVVDLIGTPTYVPEYTENTWYYLQRSLTRRAWFDPKVVEQRIVKITFDSKGQVQTATLLTESQNENITVQKHFTKSSGTEQNGIQKFVKNIGRFNKTTDGAKRRKKQK